MLSDCNLDRNKYGRLTNDEFSILCDFLFPYSQSNMKSSVRAVDLIENPHQGVLSIIDNDEESLLIQILEDRKKSYGIKTYLNEFELREVIFNSMIVVEPNVEQLIENFNQIRIILKEELKKRSQLILDNLMDEVSEYINKHESAVNSKYQKNQHLELLKDLRVKTQNLDDLSSTELLLLKNKEFLLFLMN